MYTYQTKKSEKNKNQEITYSPQQSRNRIPEIIPHPLTEINSSSDVIQCYHGIEEHDWSWRNTESARFGPDNNQNMFHGRIKNSCNILTQNRTMEAQIGDMVQYDGTIRDNIKTSRFSKILVEHVYGIVSHDGREFRGWIPYENITPEYTYEGNDDAIRNRYERMALASRSIRAWMEAGGNDRMNMLQGERNTVVHQAGRDSVIDLAHQEAARIDPENNLYLRQIDEGSNFYQQFTHFLNENAGNMPGTMARDHELRDPSIGGERAELGRAWLDRYGIEGLNESDYIVITGAENYKIFVNSNAPTWEAYNANTEDRAAGEAEPQPEWSPSENLPDRANVEALTKDRPGEYFLFHGSSKENILNIARTGFDPEYVNYTSVKGYGKTGYGSAFTDQFAKALAYAPPTKYGDPENEVYKHYVLVARVFVGNSYDAGNRARRTRGNLELTEDNINYKYSVGNKPKAQGKDRLLLGKSSDTVRRLQDSGHHLRSTFQHRQFSLQINNGGMEPQNLTYRDTSIVISDAIQMYPAYIIECEIPRNNIKTGQRSTTV